MKTRHPITRLRPARVRRGLAATAAAALALTSTALLAASPASADTLSNVSLTVSNNLINAEGTTGVTYTWAFTTTSATTTLTEIDLAVPGDTSGTPVIASTGLYGITGCDTVTPSMTAASGVITVALASCDSTNPGTPVVIAVSGLKNTATVGAWNDAAATTAVTTKDASGTVDTGALGNSVTFAADTTTVNVFVPESLTFGGGGSTILLTPIPGTAPVTPATATPVKLTVATNAAGGYTLAGCVKTDIAGGTDPGMAPSSATIKQAAETAAAGTLSTPPTTNGLFGATVGFQAGSVTGTTAAINTDSWDGTNYAGYAVSCDSGSDAHAVIASDSGPASGDTITLTNAATVSAVQPAGMYTGTITYVVTPHY